MIDFFGRMLGDYHWLHMAWNAVLIITVLATIISGSLIKPLYFIPSFAVFMVAIMLTIVIDNDEVDQVAYSAIANDPVTISLARTILKDRDKMTWANYADILQQSKTQKEAILAARIKEEQKENVSLAIAKIEASTGSAGTSSMQDGRCKE